MSVQGYYEQIVATNLRLLAASVATRDVDCPLGACDLCLIDKASDVPELL